MLLPGTISSRSKSPNAHEYVSVIKIVVSGTVSMDETFMQLGDGKVLLGTYNATIHDLGAVPYKPARAKDMKMYTVPLKGEGIMPARGLTVSGFQTKGQALSWDFRVYKPGSYEVVVLCHAGRNQTWNVEGRVRANVAGQSVENELIESKRVATPTMDPGVVDLHSVLGAVEIDSPGAHSLTLEIASDFTRAKPRSKRHAGSRNAGQVINLLLTADVTDDHPIFNPQCMAVMEEVRKAYPQRAGLYMGINPNRKAHWFLGSDPRRSRWPSSSRSRGTRLSWSASGI